jgi:hypothetical protein
MILVSVELNCAAISGARFLYQASAEKEVTVYVRTPGFDTNAHIVDVELTPRVRG